MPVNARALVKPLGLDSPKLTLSAEAREQIALELAILEEDLGMSNVQPSVLAQLDDSWMYDRRITISCTWARFVKVTELMQKPCATHWGDQLRIQLLVEKHEGQDDTFTILFILSPHGAYNVDFGGMHSINPPLKKHMIVVEDGKTIVEGGWIELVRGLLSDHRFAQRLQAYRGRLAAYEQILAGLQALGVDPGGLPAAIETLRTVIDKADRFEHGIFATIATADARAAALVRHIAGQPVGGS